MLKKFLPLLLLIAFGPLNLFAADLPLEKIKLPPGFEIRVFARARGARSMTWGEKGTLFVGTREIGSVYAIQKDGKVLTIAHGLNSPNGVAFKDGALYVAEISRILRFDHIEDQLTKPPKPVVVYSAYPTAEHHGWKFMAFGPDGKLYVPVGAPCNICKIEDPYASITRLNADGTGFEIFARGIRNSVGFDWDPDTHELWFTDNGRDMLGDDIPPDEVNHAPKAGMHFGYPFCHGGTILDDEFGKGKNCADYVPPVVKLPAHVASLGMRFYTGTAFPKEYQKRIFIAEHGSWNRSVPIGYRVVSIHLAKDGKTGSEQVFADGWLQDGKPWGRPVDVINTPQGSLLVSDDYGGAIYEIRVKGK